MKKINRKYSFPVLSVVAIFAFFIFTGGVSNQNNILDTPPTITFEAESSNSYKVAEAQRFTVQLTNYDPYQHEVTESCDLFPNIPDVNRKETDKASPESRMWVISPNGADTVKLPYYELNDFKGEFLGVLYNSKAPEGYGKLFVNYVFNSPGNWKLVCRARTVSRTPAKYKNGTLVSGGDTTYGAWAEQSYTVTIGGTAPLPQQKYTFKGLVISPAQGDPTPEKTFYFSDPARQYLEVLSPTKASLKFYWTPDAADVAAYPNLASKYEFNYQNADYTIEKYAIGGELYYGIVLHFKGQQISFRYSEIFKRFGFYKSSKKPLTGYDSFELFFD